MADPITAMTAISLGASAGGAVLGAVGANYKGQAEANMYQYQAGVAQVNQQIALQNADYAIAVGESQAQASGMQSRAQIGETKAAQGAGGLDVNSGSNAAVRDSEEKIGEYNQAVIRSDAAKRAYGYKVEAMSQASQAELDRMAAKTSRTSGYINAVSSILGGASSVSSKWADASRLGIFA